MRRNAFFLRSRLMTDDIPKTSFTTNELARFPKLAEAFNKTAVELADTMRYMTGGMPITTVPRHIVDIVDNTIDAPDASKEAVMIGVFHLLAPYALEDAASVGYSAETMELLKEVQKDAGPEKETENMAHVMVAGVTAVFAGVNPHMTGLTVVSDELVLNLEHSSRQVEDAYMPKLNAPKLSALYAAEKQKFLDLTKNTTPTSQAKPGKPAQPKF